MAVIALHIPAKHNIWADQLSRGNTSAFQKPECTLGRMILGLTHQLLRFTLRTHRGDPSTWLLAFFPACSFGLKQ